MKSPKPGQQNNSKEETTHHYYFPQIPDAQRDDFPNHLG
jgi:hypothetical protein